MPTQQICLLSKCAHTAARYVHQGARPQSRMHLRSRCSNHRMSSHHQMSHSLPARMGKMQARVLHVLKAPDCILTILQTNSPPDSTARGKALPPHRYSQLPHNTPSQITPEHMRTQCRRTTKRHTKHPALHALRMRWFQGYNRPTARCEFTTNTKSCTPSG
jgi:hypothetical protein